MQNEKEKVERRFQLEFTAAQRLNKSIIRKISHTELSLWISFIVFMMIKCIYFQFTTQLNKKPYFSAENKLMVIYSFGIIIILSTLTWLFFNRKRLTALVVVNLILSILLAADTNCFRYYYTTISMPVILNADLRLLSSVNQSIMSLFKASDLIYMLDLPFMIIGAVRLNRKGIETAQFKKKVIASTIIIALGTAPFLVGNERVNIQDVTFNRNYISKSMGVLYSHYQSVRKYISNNVFGTKTLSKSEKNKIIKFFEGREKNSGNNYKGIARGSNLIIIQAEALQEFVINRKILGSEITPNLNRLINESLYFDNFYIQTAGGNTSDAEFMCNTSLYPVEEGAVYLRYPSNTYYSLPKVLKERGYTSYALHGFKPWFYNREEMYQLLGFDQFISEEDYEMDDFAGWEGNALSDASFFRQSLDIIDTSRPFYGFFITLSCHHPFKYFEDLDFEVGEFEGSYLGNYIKGINYADQCIGQFIDQLKERGLYDNTLLVIYGDHSAVPKYHSDELMKFIGKEYSDFEWARLQKVPCIIHYPGLKDGKRISITGGEIDLFPTIANLMGIEAPYALGKDLLNTDKGYAVLRNGSVITEDYMYLSDTGEVYDASTGKPLNNKKDFKQDLRLFTDELRISDLIIEKNAFESISHRVN